MVANFLVSSLLFPCTSRCNFFYMKKTSTLTFIFLYHSHFRFIHSWLFMLMIRIGFLLRSIGALRFCSFWSCWSSIDLGGRILGSYLIGLIPIVVPPEIEKFCGFKKISVRDLKIRQIEAIFCYKRSTRSKRRTRRPRLGQLCPLVRKGQLWERKSWT